MANGNNDTTIRIGLDADLSGGVQTEKQLEAMRRKAAQLGKEGSSSVGKVTGAIGGLQKACGLLRNVLTGFGVVGVFTALAAAVGKVKDIFGAAKKQADEFDRAKAKAAHQEAVENLAKSYEKLCEATQRAAEAARHANEMHDIAMKNARELEDAQMDLAEQRELAAVDASDPAASEKRALISARYAAKRGGLGVERAREDVKTEVHRLAEEAIAKRKTADETDESAAATERLIASTRKRRLLAYSRSTNLNEEDRTGAWESGGGMVKDFVTLNWGKLGRTKTEEGDSIRKEAASEVKELDAEIKRLQEEAKKKREKAKQLRREADGLDERGVRTSKAIEALSVRRIAAEVAGTSGKADAENALAKKNREIAKKAAQKEKDEQTVSEGTVKLSEYERQKMTEKAKAQAAAAKYEREQADVFAAQNRYEMVVANGGSRKDRSAALSALQKEKEEALEAQHEMEKVAAEVANVLKAIKEEVGTLSRAVKSAQSRLKQNEADAPEG